MQPRLGFERGEHFADDLEQDQVRFEQPALLGDERRRLRGAAGALQPPAHAAVARRRAAGGRRGKLRRRGCGQLIAKWL